MLNSQIIILNTTLIERFSFGKPLVWAANTYHQAILHGLVFEETAAKNPIEGRGHI